MSSRDDKIEPLEPELSSLFGEERTRVDDAAADAAKARVFERLAQSIVAIPSSGSGGSNGGTGGTGGAVSAIGSRLILPVIAAFVIGGGVGGALVSALSSPRVVYVDRVVQSAAPSLPTVVTPTAVSGAAVDDPVSIAPSAISSAIASATPDTSLASERAILDVARTALGRGDGLHALDATEKHAHQFPHGQMTEEREALAVQALAKLGRKDDAIIRGARFKKRYPNSVLAPVIDAALNIDSASTSH